MMTGNQPLITITTFFGGLLLGVFLGVRYFVINPTSTKVSQYLQRSTQSSPEILETIVQEIIPGQLQTSSQVQMPSIPSPPSSPIQQPQQTPIIRTTRTISYTQKSKYSIGISTEIKNSSIFTYRADASIRLADTPLHLVAGISTTPTLSIGLRYEF